MSASTMIKSRCALGKPEDQNGLCITEIHDELILNYTDEASLQSIKAICNDEECVLEKAKVPEKVAESIKRESLKPEVDSVDHNYWLNNTEIDSVMSQLRINYPGFTHGFIHMSDLVSFSPANKSTFLYKVLDVESIDFGTEFKLALEGKLGQLDTAVDPNTGLKAPLKSFGIVCNTDSSKGSGQHWFAVYISTDYRDPENTSKPWIRIELFNSGGGGSGNKYFDEFWLKKSMEIARATNCKCTFDIITDIKHQSDKTGNCGSYSLFYIYSRLNGTKAEEFDNPEYIISDNAMRKFREVCFTT